MKHFLWLLATLALCATTLTAQPMEIPFDFVIPVDDSTNSQWLPTLPIEEAGSHGRVRVSEDGHLEFEDGTSMRFVGVSIQGAACFPDSVGALATAARLRKMGVNLVEFSYFDYHNSNSASTLAPGQRSDTLSPSQMARLDWFLYQLKRNGIYAHFLLKTRGGPRRDDGVWGWDSAYSSGQIIAHFSSQMQAMQRRYLTKLFEHRNPYTGMRYADDPVIALHTILADNSLHFYWINDYLNTRSGIISYHHSRLLDTLFSDFLRRRYKTTDALRAAYWEGRTTVGPSVVKNGGFESFTDNWSLTVGEGAQASPVIVQGSDAAPGDGPNSLRVAVRQVNGNEGRIVLDQTALPIKQGGIYQLSFKAKTDTAAGRPMRVLVYRSSPSYLAQGADTSVNLTTNWQGFSITFRAAVSDSLSSTIRFYMGRTRGDVFLDGITLQETGRAGLGQTESLEASNVARTRFSLAPKISLRRMFDLTEFYDSLARAYYRGIYQHMRSLGVKAPIAASNVTNGAFDIWVQSELDFTSRSSLWDANGARTGMSYSDSTWVIRNYSVLAARDQKIPDFSRASVVGKPFIADAYGTVFPNAHRSEMMLFFPAYASLHGWDGIYFYRYNNSQTELATRRRMLKDDFWGIMADPSVMALMPQVSQIYRNHWIAAAERTINVQYDEADLRSLPLTFYQRGLYDIDGTFDNVATMVSAVRIDSFAASRHYTSADYYFTVPDNDRIQSDTREILRDVTKSLMTLDTRHAQGGTGLMANVSSLRTAQLSAGWLSGGEHVTYLWSSLDTLGLDTTSRSLLTISTRALNTGALWQFGDSSLGKNWGNAPTQLESVRLGLNFYTNADTIRLYPLDTLGMPTGRTIDAMRASDGSYRVVLDLASEKTPWFGVEQIFNATVDTTLSVGEASSAESIVGTIAPTPASHVAGVELNLPIDGAVVSATIVDNLGRTVAVVPSHRAIGGRSRLDLPIRDLRQGAYLVTVTVNDSRVTRRLVKVGI